MKSFLNENDIRSDFTNPNAPQEDGRGESFHGIIGKVLEDNRFSTLEDLENRLIKFYFSYNNHRRHSGTFGVPSAIF